MAYPPSSRRLNDKKRYYYSNNPNRRHPAPYPHRSYGNGYPHNYQATPSANEVPLNKNNIRTNNTLEKATTTTSSQLSQTVLENHNKTNDTVRPSRYNQPVSRKTSVPSSIASSSSVPGPVNTTVPVSSKAIPTLATHNTTSNVVQSIPTTPLGHTQPTTSRYNSDYHENTHTSSSNHGTQQTHKPISTGNSTESIVSSPLAATHSKSRYSANVPSRYNPYNPNQPSNLQSGYVNPNKTPLQKSHSQQYLPSQRNRPRSVDSTSFEKSYKPTTNSTVEKPSFPVSNSSSTASFFNRGNKWRSHISHTPSVTSSTSETYSNAQYPSQRSNFWRGSVSKHSGYSIGNEPIPASNRFNMKPTNMEPTSVDPLVKQNIPVNEVNEHNKNVKLSPRSSLIRSVPQTTRETTKQTPINYRNYDLQRSRANTPLSSADDIEMENNESENEIILPSIDTRYELEKLKPKSTDLWTVEQKKEIIAKNEEEDTETKLIEDNEETTGIMEAKSPELKKMEQGSGSDENQKLKYEYISDPLVLKTDVKKLTVLDTSAPFSVKFPIQEKCIFPLNRVETKLWELKYQDRSNRISKQKYLLKNPIKSFKEYPFFTKNITNQKNTFGPRVLTFLEITKKFDRMHIFSLSKLHESYKESWEKDCKQMEKVNSEVRKDEIEYRKKEDEKRIEKEEQEKHQEEHSSSSRRRNRADFVDDTEMESVMLQIDPDYKHVQAAAIIPDLQLNALTRHSKKFKNVNNLTTDKDKWASRLLTDGIDNFSEHEHELFLEGYLTHPKKFGKISHHMGGLRTPEECVLHYYRTKRNVDYKELLVQKNKKRKSNAAAKRRSKKKEKTADFNESFVEQADGSRQSSNDTTEKESIEKLPHEETVTVETETKNFIEKDNAPKMEQVIVGVEETKPTEITPVENIVQKEPAPEISTVQSINEVPINDTATKVIAAEPTVETAVNQPIIRNVPESTTDVNTAELVVEPRPEAVQEHIVESTQAGAPVLQNTVEVPKSQTIIHETRTDEIIIPKKRIFENIGHVQQPTETSSDNITENENIMGRQGTLETSEEYYDSDGTRKRQRIISDHKSSYWSVKEAQAFPELLQRYGSQWTLISEKLATKSTTMVRNYYQRNAAQYGWKSIVEDTDLRRNASSSDSVQQTQILIQPEQQPVIQIANGIPMQQKPTLGFFSNPTDRSIVNTDTTSGQPFNLTNEHNRDSFSNASTPTSTLPPPRLPSIQLGPNPVTVPQRQAAVPSVEPMTNVNTISGHPSDGNNNIMNLVQKESSACTSIANLMNGDSNMVNNRTPSLVSGATTTVGPPLIPSTIKDSKIIPDANLLLPRRVAIRNYYCNPVPEESNSRTVPQPTVGPPLIPSTIKDNKIIPDANLLLPRRVAIRNYYCNPVPEESNSRTVPQPTVGPTKPLVSPLSAQITTTVSSDNNNSINTHINSANDDTRIVVQDMNVPPQYSKPGSSHPRLGSISSLLNPVSSMQPRSNLPPTNYNSVSMNPQRSAGNIQPKVAVPDFNFANDPLAALAAVASAPETLASMTPQQNPNTSQSK